MSQSSDRQMRHQWSWLDESIVVFHRILSQNKEAQDPPRPSPADEIDDAPLTVKDAKHSAGLMRVNHAGEVCAQALYLGHAAASLDLMVQRHMHQSAFEEYDHLSWCQQRLEELSAKPSCLQPFWYAGSFMIGYAVACCGDGWALGFVAETEKQVERHLEHHLEQLPVDDHKSRAVLCLMQQEEREHGQKALEKGAYVLPSCLRYAMTFSSKIMTHVAYWV